MIKVRERKRKGGKKEGKKGEERGKRKGIRENWRDEGGKGKRGIREMEVGEEGK
jgi:hypothetical protein